MGQVRQNMTPEGMKRWKETQAYEEYRRYRDNQKYNGYTERVTRRGVKVMKGTATPSETDKVKAYLNRHTQQSAGKKRFGEGRSKVSAHTAALRNWGYCPTGRFAGDV